MRPMIVRLSCLAGALMAIGLLTYQTADRVDASIPRIAFAGGADSVEALAQHFLAALAANDRQGIERLRVDETEYRAFIMPGSVKPGQPPQIMPEDKSEYFWRHHNTLSYYTLNNLLKIHGDNNYRLEKVDAPRVQQYAWYTAHRAPILHLQTEDGHELQIQLGSIAEHEGRFKFISYRFD